jgi:uracil-DNA glycosylase family 4
LQSIGVSNARKQTTDHCGVKRTMHPTQFREALTQVLENYRRCGVSRFARGARDELPPALLARIAEMGDSPPSLEPPSDAPVAAAQDRHVPPDVAARSLPATAEQVWSLPVLGDSQRQERFEQLASEVRECRKCANIVSFRQQTVFGDGLIRPRVCFMGEAPGADEDRLGKPFVGKAGQLLTKIIQAMKLSRDEVYILNALKCRPPQNRTPMQDEIENCRHFVENQLEVLQPEYIVCLGAVAVRSILESSLSIGRLRGKFHRYRGAQVVVTYHPSYLLRNESAKKLVWDDMKMLMRHLQA